MLTATSSALTVIPVPAITLSVSSPDEPPPVKPAPAVTPVTSPANDDSTPFVAVKFVPAIADTKSAMLSF